MTSVSSVPGEASHQTIPAELMQASRGTGEAVDVTYTPACDATDHTIYYGDLASVATYSYTDAACTLGVSGNASFDPGAGSFFFLVVANNGTEEGTYGEWYDGVTSGQRPPAVGLLQCDYTQNLNGVTCE